MLATPQKRAAAAYAFYGVVYLVGAIMELTPERKVVFWGFVPWWAFYVAGAALLLSLPVFIARGVRWLTATLAFFTAGKALWLFWIQGRNFAAGDGTNPYNWFFAVVAIGTSYLLVRALVRR